MMVSDLKRPSAKRAASKEHTMYPHPQFMQELARQHQIELIEDAIRYRRVPRGRHRRHALRISRDGGSGRNEEH
jgi:hypothetical protein